MSRAATAISRFKETSRDITGHGTRHADNDEDLDNDHSQNSFAQSRLMRMEGNKVDSGDFLDDNIARFVRGPGSHHAYEDDEEGNPRNTSGHSVSSRNSLLRSMRATAALSTSIREASDFLTRRVSEPAKRLQAEKHHDPVKSPEPGYSSTFNDASHHDQPERRRLINFGAPREVGYGYNREFGARFKLLPNGTKIVFEMNGNCHDNLGRIVTGRDGNEYFIANNEVRRQRVNSQGRLEYVDQRNASTDAREFALRSADRARTEAYYRSGQSAQDRLDGINDMLAGKTYAMPGPDSDEESAPAPATRPPRSSPQRQAAAERRREQRETPPVRDAFRNAGNVVEAVAGREVRHAVGQTARNAFHAAADTADNVRQAADETGRNVSRTFDNGVRAAQNLFSFGR